MPLASVRQGSRGAGQLRGLVPVVSAMATQPRVRRLHKASLTAPSLCLARGPAGLKPGPKEAAALSKVDAVRDLMIVLPAMQCSARTTFTQGALRTGPQLPGAQGPSPRDASRKGIEGQD
ncbi:MAG: hypothetical protein RXO24_03350 [Acidilobus sp.]